MLEFVGKGKSHNCNGTTRRDFLRVGALGGLGMTRADYLWAQQHGTQWSFDSPQQKLSDDFFDRGKLGETVHSPDFRQGRGETLKRANENSTRGLENCRVLKFDRQTKLRSSGQKATT